MSATPASPVKHAVHLALNDPLHAGPIGKTVASGLSLLILANALLIFVVFDHSIDESTHFGLLVFDFASTAVFLVEYLARVWTADLLYPDRRPARARLRYIMSLMGVVDLLAVAPFVAVVLGFVPYQTLNSFRVLRVMRLIKVSRYMRGLDAIGRVLRNRRHEIVASFSVLLLLVITASVLMYQVENPVQPEKFDSVLTGMYWALTTITTTGYGDLVPLTSLGRLIGFVTMALSIGIVAIPAGIFTAGFVDEMHRTDGRETGASGADGGSSADSTANDSAASAGEDPAERCPHCGRPLR